MTTCLYCRGGMRVRNAAAKYCSSECRTRHLREAEYRRRRAEGRCGMCGDPTDSDFATCESCRKDARDRYRDKARIPRSRPIKVTPRRCELCAETGHTAATCEGAVGKSGECVRCFEPAARDGLCAEHLQTLAQVAEERKRGLWAGLER